MWRVEEGGGLGRGGYRVILGVEEGKEGVEKGEGGAWRSTNGVEWRDGWME